MQCALQFRSEFYKGLRPDIGHMKRVTLGTNMLTSPMVVLAISVYGTIALPPAQKLPSVERPFVYTHVVGCRPSCHMK